MFGEIFSRGAATDLDVAITNQCGRLIANVIIAYNSILLSALLEAIQSRRRPQSDQVVEEDIARGLATYPFPGTLPVPWQPPSNRCRGATRRRGSLA